MKKTKQLFSLTLALLMTASLSFPASARDLADDFNMNEDGFPGLDSDIPGYEAIFETPVHLMTDEELRQNGLLPDAEPQAAIRNIYDYCIVKGTSDYPVYSSSSATEQIGFVSPRERIYVWSNQANVQYYFIEFKNYGKNDSGYLSREAIQFPVYGFSRPIETGRISRDYMVNGHHGIDVAVAEGTPIYAICDGTYTPKVWTAYNPDDSGQTKLVNYGNALTTEFTDNNGITVQVIYAHLSDFEYGEPETELESYREYYDDATSNWTTQSQYAKVYSKGEKIGESGNTGNSSGPHLHFETRKKNNRDVQYDPFKFVVFPDIGY